MSDEVEAALGELRALCGGGFGPCGAQALLFRPPDAPVVTGSGHAVLAAWKEALDGKNHGPGDQGERHGIARFVLSAVDGLQREAGDGTSELVLLLDSAVKLTSTDKTYSYSESGAHRRQLSRALGALKWALQGELAETNKRGALCGQLRIPVDIELEPARRQVDGREDCDEGSADGRLRPTGEFRRQLLNVLRSALGGLFGSDVCEFLIRLVIEWLFRVPWSSTFPKSESVDSRLLFQRAQSHLKRAPDAVMFMTSPTFGASCVLPPVDFILRQSVVGAQQHHQFNNSLSTSTEAVRFVCITCSLSLDSGANHVTLAMPRASSDAFDDWMSVKDATRSFISRYLRALSVTHGVRLLICTEPIKEDVVATCTRYDIACVQFVEPEEVTALGIASGTVALASLFDEIVVENHVGQCCDGVATLRLQHRPCLRLCGVAPSAAEHGDRDDVAKQSSFYREHAVVPQLLLHAPSKGIYKQYYAGIVKALRVLQSWFKPNEYDPPTRLSVCRGAGATELMIARFLRAHSASDALPDVENLSLSGVSKHEDCCALQARRIVADALLEVVVQLQQNLRRTCGGDEHSTAARRQVIALLATRTDQCKQGENHTAPLFVLDQQCRIETRAGAISCPQLAQADPVDAGVVHPWARTETLLFQMLSTLEQLFRIDSVLHVKRVRAPRDREEEDEHEDLYA